MPLTYLKLNQYDVSASAGVASIEFTNISQSFDDLIIRISARGTRAAIDSNIGISFNGSTANFSGRYLEGDGTSAASGILARFLGAMSAANSTSSTFGNAEVYIPNYTGSTNKSFSSNAVQENNATTAYMSFNAGLWSQTAAITSITLTSLSSDNFVLHSSATLYGIKRT